MNIQMTKRKNCRICESDKVHQFLHFKDYPLSDNFLPSANSDEEFLCDYQAHWCEDCQTVQNLTNFDWSSYYADYDYTVSTSGFARQFMNQIADQVIQQYGFSAGDCAVEIGSADGFQLGCFAERGFKVFGYEPSKRLAETSNNNGVNTTQSLFDDSTLGLIPADFDKVQVFLSFYTFDHIPDPLACLKSIRQKIDPQRGIAVIEIHDLQQIIERREACLFCHEHTIYLSQQSLERMLQRAGMKLLNVDLLPESQCRGNSLLAVCAADTSVHEPTLTNSTETESWTEQWSTFEIFAAEVEVAHQYLHDYIHRQIDDGKKIAGYGASARSISTLSLAKIDSKQIEYLCDGNPHLHQKYLPYSGVQVVTPETLENKPVDEVIVFAYGYFDEIVSQNQVHQNRGGKFTSLLDLLKNNDHSLQRRKAS